jgi:hypothetical protein
MPARKPPQPDDPAEYQRFLDMAREVEADDTPGALDRAFEKIVKPKQRTPAPNSDTQERSD